jgi:hypothetical protein
MVVNQDHYINRVLHEAGEYALTVDEFDTPWVNLAARVLVDPGDLDDVAAVNALQDLFKLDGKSSKPLETPDYDLESFDATRRAVLELAKHAGSFDHAFGTKEEVDPIRHLVGTAAGWGGLPDAEARYKSVEGGPRRRVQADGARRPRRRLLVDLGLQRQRLLRAERPQRLSVNNLTATRNDDDSVTVHFGGDDDCPNLLPITDGWSCTVRMYRPRPEILDGSWTFPSFEPV